MRSRVLNFIGQLGQVNCLFSLTGGWVTILTNELDVPCLFEVPTQSEPVSPHQ